MNNRFHKTIGIDVLCLKYLVVGATLFLGVSLPALAVDGVIEINQAKAMAGGVTPGDSPGFPVTLDSAGSYRLTGNLTVSNTNTDAIAIVTNDVTLDLNGFVIIGPGPSSGTGKGVDLPGQGRASIKVVNGTIRRMGSDGIGSDSFVAARVYVENIRALDNGRDGIRVGNACTVTRNIVKGNLGNGILAGNNCTVIGNTAESNGLEGIQADTGSTVISNTAAFSGDIGILANLYSTVVNNTARNNANHGIFAAVSTVNGNAATSNGGDGIRAPNGSVVTGNTAHLNTGFGLRLDNGSGYAENVVTNNTGGTVQAGVQMGTNVCGATNVTANTTCP